MPVFFFCICFSSAATQAAHKSYFISIDWTLCIVLRVQRVESRSQIGAHRSVGQCVMRCLLCASPFEALKLKWRARTIRMVLNSSVFVFHSCDDWIQDGAHIVAVCAWVLAAPVCGMQEKCSIERMRPSSLARFTLLHIFKTVCWSCSHLAYVTSLDLFLLPLVYKWEKLSFLHKLHTDTEKSGEKNCISGGTGTWLWCVHSCVLFSFGQCILFGMMAEWALDTTNKNHTIENEIGFSCEESESKSHRDKIPSW